MTNRKLKLSGLMLAGIIIIVSFVYAINVQPVVIGGSGLVETYSGLKNFESYQEFTEFLKDSSHRGAYYPNTLIEDGTGVEIFSKGVNSDSSGGTVVDYSQTNVQVTGVDEPDVVKTDGAYLYVVSGNKVIIVKATPAENATIECQITVNESLTILNIFISGSRLVLFVQDYNYPIYDKPYVLNSGIKAETGLARWYSSPDTHIQIYELGDIKNPELVKDVSVPGSFTGARLIGDYVYLVTIQYSWDVYSDENQTIVPFIRINGEAKEIPLTDIAYIDINETSKTLTNIVSVNIHDDTKDVTAKIFILGNNAQVLYVSKDNIYVVSSSTNYYDYNTQQKILEEIITPRLPELIKLQIETVKTLSLEDYQKEQVIQWLIQNYTNSMTEEEKNNIAREISKRYEKTVIHRISISDGNIEYVAQGEIPGQVSNQFSLSEYNEHLRVSSTIWGNGISWFSSTLQRQNNIYVLNMDLEIVGSVEGLAPGENIYATRFLEDKCYLVTFRQVDPFFVIDLSDPTSPKVLGQLKIPGYSTYLHPYDDQHIIGIGMDGGKVKISLFDVTDMSNPVELSKYEISNVDWGTSSALYEHKAFLFDKEKNLLVIPAGVYSKESAYVFNISVETGINLKGVISHNSKNSTETQDSWNYNYGFSLYNSGYSIKRTLYIRDVLYTISDKMVKMNSLDDLSEINSINLL